MLTMHNESCVAECRHPSLSQSEFPMNGCINIVQYHKYVWPTFATGVGRSDRRQLSVLLSLTKYLQNMPQC